MSEKSSESSSGSGAMSSRSSKGAFIVPVYKFAIIVDQISIIDRKVTIIKQVQLTIFFFMLDYKLYFYICNFC